MLIQSVTRGAQTSRQAGNNVPFNRALATASRNRFKPRLRILTFKWAPESTLLLLDNEVLKIVH